MGRARAISLARSHRAHSRRRASPSPARAALAAHLRHAARLQRRQITKRRPRRRYGDGQRVAGAARHLHPGGGNESTESCPAEQPTAYDIRTGAKSQSSLPPSQNGDRARGRCARSVGAHRPIGCRGGLLEALIELPAKSPPALALVPGLVERTRASLDDWQTWHRDNLEKKMPRG